MVAKNGLVIHWPPGPRRDEQSFSAKARAVQGKREAGDLDAIPVLVREQEEIPRAAKEVALRGRRRAVKGG